MRNAFGKHIRSDMEVQKKTSELVRDYIQCSPIKLANEMIKLDEKGIEIIKEKNQPDELKIINLIKSIEKQAEEKANDPMLISVKERANEIKEAWDVRQITTQEALRYLIELLRKKYNGLRSRNKRVFLVQLGLFVVY